MSTEEEYKELSAKLRYGLELAEQRLIEETARREGICYISRSYQEMLWSSRWKSSSDLSN